MEEVSMQRGFRTPAPSAGLKMIIVPFRPCPLLKTFILHSLEKNA